MFSSHQDSLSKTLLGKGVREKIFQQKSRHKMCFTLHPSMNWIKEEGDSNTKDIWQALLLHNFWIAIFSESKIFLSPRQAPCLFQSMLQQICSESSILCWEMKEPNKLEIKGILLMVPEFAVIPEAVVYSP